MVILDKLLFLRPVSTRVTTLTFSPPGSLSAVRIREGSKKTKPTRDVPDQLTVDDGGRTGVEDESGQWQNVYDHEESNSAEIKSSGREEGSSRLLFRDSRIIDLGGGITARVKYHGRRRKA